MAFEPNIFGSQPSSNLTSNSDNRWLMELRFAIQYVPFCFGDVHCLRCLSAETIIERLDNLHLKVGRFTIMFILLVLKHE